jgi:HAD superfamily hydrolase (TIGR01509 family)
LVPDDGGSAVTLDLWHTLIYLEPDAEEAYMASQLDLAAEVLAGSEPLPGAPSLSLREMRAAFETVYAEAVREAQEGRSVPPGVQLQRAANRVGRVSRPLAYVDGLTRLVAAAPFRPAPRVLEVLRSLRASGHRLAVISNTVGEPGAALRPRLAQLGIEGLIDEFEFSDNRPWTKPAPEIFREAVDRLGVRPDRAVHVGDGWVDIEGARRAAFRAGILYTGLQRYGQRYHALFLPPGWANPPTDFRVERLEQVPPLVERILDRHGPA